jgi:imidazoleglycerol phosphate synthase glutamine amidotransferase subunit HisH
MGHYYDITFVYAVGAFGRIEEKRVIVKLEEYDVPEIGLNYTHHSLSSKLCEYIPIGVSYLYFIKICKKKDHE